MKTITPILTLLFSLSLAACGADSTAEADAAQPPAATDGYEAFKESNYENQLVRVGAYDQIHALRKSDELSPESFGGTCDAWSADVKTPTDSSRLGSLYIETASLAAKVEGRKDDHDYNAGAELGADIHAGICAAIEAGGKLDTGTDANASQGLGWQAQIVDKSLLHFFYLSVYHEMVVGSRAHWDEAFGYFGMSADGSEAGGFAATAASRDKNCKTSYATEIFDALIAGQNKLDEQLNAEGLSGNDDELSEIGPDLAAIIQEVDTLMLEVVALSFGRELFGLPEGSKPHIKLIEARMFFRILKPALADYDSQSSTTYATDLGAVFEQDDPSLVDPDAGFAAIEAVFGLDVKNSCE